jgi:hypothetical protein
MRLAWPGPLQILSGQVSSQPTSAELQGLLCVELQLVDAQFEQLPSNPQPAQSKARFLATAEHNLERYRRVVDQPFERLQYLGVLDELQVVQEKHQAMLEAGDVPRQILQQGF